MHFLGVKVQRLSNILRRKVVEDVFCGNGAMEVCHFFSLFEYAHTQLLRQQKKRTVGVAKPHSLCAL